MYFADELHKANQGPSGSAGKFSSKEMDLAKRVIETLASGFKPEQYHDEYRKNVEKLIAQKRKGREVPVVEQPRNKPVIDIMEALRQSLEGNKSHKAKKPAHARRKAA
jgi:DNA end-binding protein Ku